MKVYNMRGMKESREVNKVLKNLNEVQHHLGLKKHGKKKNLRL